MRKIDVIIFNVKYPLRKVMRVSVNINKQASNNVIYPQENKEKLILIRVDI